MNYFLACLLLISLLSYLSDLFAIDFYVSPLGEDSWSGLNPEVNADSTDGPFKTLTQARSAIRILDKNTLKKEQITVHVASGEYFLEKPLVFDTRDSGWQGKSIVWQSNEEHPATLSAGRKLDNCSNQGPGLWACNTDDLELSKIAPLNRKRIKGNMPGFNLYVNNKRLQLARWPDKGWAYIKHPIDTHNTFKYIGKSEPHYNSSSNADIYIWPGNDWYDQYIGISNIDITNNLITLSSPTTYPLSSGRRFAIINSKENLDTSWEWYYDQSNKKVFFILPPEESPKEVVVSYLKNALKINGTNNFSLKDVHIKYSTNSGIQIHNANKINVKNVEISEVGGKGIDIDNSSDITIRNTDIHHTGMGGISMSGGARKELTRSNNLIINTHIHHIGNTLANHSPAIRLNGVGSTVKNNLINHTPGIALWIRGNDHLIEKNEIHNACTQASDCGAIYSGRDWSNQGNIVRYNNIHDLYGNEFKRIDPLTNEVEYGPGGVRGVYLDDGASGFQIIGNIFNNAGFIGIQVGGGRDNTIQNNIIKSDHYAILVDNRWPNYNWKINRDRLASSPYLTSIWRQQYPKLSNAMNNDTWPENNVLTSNIIISTSIKNTSLRYFLPAKSSIIGKNIVWNQNNNIKVDFKLLDRKRSKAGATWLEWLRENIEQESIFSDPCIELNENSAVSCESDLLKRINFLPIPKDIGLQARHND